jgi:hypothetical protein
MGVGGGDGKAYGFHGWQIDDVVAHKGRLARCKTLFGEYREDCRPFVLATLNEKRNPQVLRPPLYDARGAASDNSDPYAACDKHFNAVPVTAVEGLDLFPRIRQKQPSIGQHAIDVE